MTATMRPRSAIEADVAARRDLVYAERRLLREGRLEDLLVAVRDRHRADQRLMRFLVPAHALWLFQAIVTGRPAEIPEGLWPWMKIGFFAVALGVVVLGFYLGRSTRADMRRVDEMLDELSADRGA